MIRVKTPGLAILLTSLLVPGLSHGVNWQWLNDAAVKSFTEKDWELMQSTARQALDHYPDRTKVIWSNPDNQHSGSIEVLDTQTVASTICRTTVFQNNAGGKEGTTRINLCRQEDGSWKIPVKKPAAGP